MKQRQDLPDEELLLLSREGHEAATRLLTERFFGLRHYLCRMASPALATQMDEWSLNEAFFRSYLSAWESYEFHRARFTSFLECILAHEMQRTFNTKKRQFPDNLLSLDSDFVSGTEDYCLHDIVPSGETRDDPREFLLYSEGLVQTNSPLPRGINPQIIEMARLSSEGLSYTQIGIRFGVGKGQVHYCLSKYRRWALRVLRKTLSLNDSETVEKDRSIARFLRMEQ